MASRENSSHMSNDATLRGNSSNTMDENELKKTLYDSMKNAGVLGALKSQLRSKLYDQLRLKNEKPTGKDQQNLTSDSKNRISYKIAISLCADLMQKCDMPYALSVFMPEAGISDAPLAKAELIDILALQTDDVIAGQPDSTPLLLDLVERIKHNKGVSAGKMSSSAQTEDIDSAVLSLDQKLQRIDLQVASQVDMERAAPYKQMESRILKMRAELEARYTTDLQSEIRRLKEFEMSKMRMEEAAMYRDKLDNFRSEMEQMHIDKVKELKLREQSAQDRLKGRESEIEKLAYEHRQKVLKDEEILRYRESDVKKTVEMELILVKGEKERMARQIREYEHRVSDVEQLKLRLEKQHIEEVERFKSEYQRQFKDQDFDIHRRRLVVDEEEHRVALDKDRILQADTRLKVAENEVNTLRKEQTILTKEHQISTKESFEAKDQLKTLNHNLKNMADAVASRERECKTTTDENRSLQSLYTQLRTDAEKSNQNQDSLIKNLRLQLDETREVIAMLKEGKEREYRKLNEKCQEEIRRETDKYQFEYDKLRDEITMYQRRLGQEENLNKQMGFLNEKMQGNLGDLRNQYKVEVDEDRIDILAGVQSKYHQPPSSLLQGDELVDRKKAWAELEREQGEIQRDIKSLMRLEPSSRQLADPGLAQRVSPQKQQMQSRTNEPSYVPQASSSAAYQQQRPRSNSPADNMVGSQKTKQTSQKRQWLAPSGSEEGLDTKKAPVSNITTNNQQSYQPEQKYNQVLPESQYSQPQPASSSNQAQKTSSYNADPKPASQTHTTTTNTFNNKPASPSDYKPLNPPISEPAKPSPTSGVNPKPFGSKPLFKGGGTNPFAKRTDSKPSSANNSLVGISNTAAPQTTNTFQPQIIETKKKEMDFTQKSSDSIKDEFNVSGNQIQDDYSEDDFF